MLNRIPPAALILLLPATLVAQAPDRPLAGILERQIETLDQGLRYHHLVGREVGADPWSAHMLEVDLTRYGVEIALATDQIVGQEAPSSLVERHGAAAGVNGGFSVSNDPWSIIHGDPNGFFVDDGIVLSEPVASRPALGFCGPLGAQAVRVVTPTLAVLLRPDVLPGAEVGLNRARGHEDVVVYTPQWNATTLTHPGGLELVVRRGRVVSVERGGSARIPRDGFVVSASGGMGESLEGVRVGAVLELEMEVWDETGERLDLSGCDYTSAGPVIARNGVVVGEYPAESYRKGFVLERHPRTAVGVGADGRTLLLFVVDGRQPSRSVGATLEELADLVLAEGAAMVYNLDGGGSSAMALTGRGVVNFPSDGQERRRCDVVLVRRAPSSEPLRPPL